jgi:adenine-specific DNA-methyltransferase
MTKKSHRISPPILHHARRMRREPTKAEQSLWQRLRRWQLDGHKFRRQHPIGGYVVDFCCPEMKLIVELDGDVHGFQEKRDTRRTAELEAEGYHVILFWNEQVLRELEAVLAVILAVCDERKQV